MARGPKPTKSKEAKPPATRTSPKDDGARARDLEQHLAEARAQQAATAEILRVIGASPTDVQPVFDAIVERAARLCDAEFSAVARFDDGRLRLVSMNRVSPEEAEAWHRLFPRRPERGFVMGRAVVDTRATHVEDVLTDPDYDIRTQETILRLTGYRTFLGIPIMNDNVPLGVLGCGRRRVKPFTATQIELVKTFADQAVIAIENVRLFNETKEALEQQTATAEILRVIASSPTDLQPVLDAVTERAARLCGASDAVIFRADGGTLTPVATCGVPAVSSVPRTRGTASGRAIVDRQPVHVEDLASPTSIAEFPDANVPRARGIRTQLAVPLLREGEAIGVILIRRFHVQPFTEQQIALLKTFADQAVIAIENVRLFKELELRNVELTDTLARQTATGEVLGAISRAQSDAQPVFEIIAASALRLCAAGYGSVQLYDGELLHLAAAENANPEGTAALRRAYPRRPGESLGGRVIRSGAVVQIPDVLEDPAYELKNELRAMNLRGLLAVPMLRNNQPIGVIIVGRAEPGSFSSKEVELLKTFADQAVIAIENVRLFKELEARTQQLTGSVAQLTALREVGHAVSSSLDLETVLNTIVARAVQLAGAHSGTIWEYDAAAEEFILRITQNVEDPELRANPNARVRRGEGAVGRLAISQRPVQIPDITYEGAYEARLRDSLVGAGTRALLAIPLLHEDQLLGGLVISRRTPGEFQAEVVDLLASFATQSALAIQNARLFLEIEDKSRQLEAASQHKSEFLANMSHELRTPLNAIIGFSEVLSEKMFGELNEKQEEYSKDIHASGQHLLSLINDILDLSKIEAGRMELELSDFHLPTALDSALTLVRERAGRRGIALHLSVDERLGQIQADERKVRQVVLNLLSNAIKFTPEGGRIDVGAAPRDGFVEVSVTDTGVGIAPEDQEAVFEEFRQVGTADKKVEGTGLGLTLCRKFVELHGGKVWVKSELGKGSTFTFTIPVSHGE